MPRLLTALALVLSPLALAGCDDTPETESSVPRGGAVVEDDGMTDDVTPTEADTGEGRPSGELEDET